MILWLHIRFGCFGFGALLVVEEGVYVLILRFWGLGRLGFRFEFGVFGFS